MLALAAALVGCTGEECLQNLDVDCAPLYEPTFANVFTNTLAPSCGIGGSACHAREGSKNGLVLVEIEEAHRLLLDQRVEAGEASCSLMMQRLESDDPEYQMPPRLKLSDAERCAVQRWIQNGAIR